MELAQIVQLLKEKGFRPTAQRIAIYESLAARKDHPTVEMLYKQLQPQHPTLSKTTVYNTLSSLAEAQLIRIVSIDKTEARYDADMSFHGHFQCLHCGEVSDFTPPFTEKDIPDLKVTQIRSRDLYLTGICAHCG